MEKATAISGLINLNKPAGISSAAAVNRVKPLLPHGNKIGHAGTLDPFATGVLLLLIGKATKASHRLMNQPKRYEAIIKLGATTATDDPESAEVPILDPPRPSRQEIQSALVQLIGTIRQRPPAFSAIKFGGRRAYQLARSGKTPQLQPREVRIDAIEIIGWNWPLLHLRIDCGRGTYIRAVARDLGEALKTGGYLAALRRTRIGDFTIDDAVDLDQLQQEGIVKYLRACANYLGT